MTKESPDIKPLTINEYTSKQSKYEIAPRVPFRSCIDGPSGSGKTVLLVNMILDVYRDVFERVCIFLLLFLLILVGNLLKSMLRRI